MWKLKWHKKPLNAYSQNRRKRSHPFNTGIKWKLRSSPSQKCDGPLKFWPRGASRGWRRPAEAKIFLGLNGSFWPKRRSLKVPDGVQPPRTLQQPPKAGRGHIFLAQKVPFDLATIPGGSWKCRASPGPSRPNFFRVNMFLLTLMVSDSVGSPQDPSSGLEATKAAKAEIFFKG